MSRAMASWSLLHATRAPSKKSVTASAVALLRSKPEVDVFLSSSASRTTAIDADIIVLNVASTAPTSDPGSAACRRDTVYQY
eukprot:CAMPEP_0182938260 /NCGR_PEP_ID=MMETSP0105_2-20130417/43562_1 /TAXON_ID=81532 ORGANISM="Acanthoeca-like sp., Strain 10tr" /NCGR_SAMPLE_ID=MMETSP0105_2 /ASSEMBLY_ACC=CAM_ASM_000205 /LENGTH=81 /DNA_ID=CAMNT_0025077547 /DNA_START=191 /DNA_END=433 /DNA_ORIENTATION=-